MQWEEKDNWPTVRMYNPIWKDSSDVKIPSDFLKHREVKAITESIKMIREEFGDEVAIIGKTMGPWTLAYHVFGVESFLLGSVDNPEETFKALEKLTEISILFGQAQIDAGADVLTFPDHATGDLVSGEYYKRFLQDIHTDMVGGIGLVGNINNPETLYAKDPEDVKEEVFKCLDAGVQMIAPECAVPLATKAQNLIAIPEAVKDWTNSKSND